MQTRRSLEIHAQSLQNIFMLRTSACHHTRGKNPNSQKNPRQLFQMLPLQMYVVF